MVLLLSQRSLALAAQPLYVEGVADENEDRPCMLEVLILAAIALFVLSRLYAALGRDDGPPEGRDRARPGQVARAPTEPPTERTGERPAAAPAPTFTGPAAGGLEEIYQADRRFDPRDFLAGARAAYEMIVEAYANGDRDTLKPLLDDDVYTAWDDVISKRETSGEEPYRLLRLKGAEIDAAELDGQTARVMVRYEAELGDGEHVRRAREIWTFKRDVTSPDPNWVLDDVESAT